MDGVDSATGVLIDGGQMLAFVHAVFWVFLRIGATLMTAPPLAARALPTRVRLLLAILVSAVVAPMLPPPPVAPDMATLALIVARELAVGLTLGFLLRLAFEAAAVAGELVAQGMAMSFAQMADPVNNGAQSALLGQWFNLAFVLLFFAFDTHLALIRMLAQSYGTLPVGSLPQDLGAFLGAVPSWLAMAMQVGVRIALPVLAAMMAVNIAFGLMSRSAPALNPIALGLPAALLFGLFLLAQVTGLLGGPVADLFSGTLDAMASLVR